MAFSNMFDYTWVLDLIFGSIAFFFDFSLEVFLSTIRPIYLA